MLISEEIYLHGSVYTDQHTQAGLNLNFILL